MYSGCSFDQSFQARASCLEVCISACSSSLGIRFGEDVYLFLSKHDHLVVCLSLFVTSCACPCECFTYVCDIVFRWDSSSFWTGRSVWISFVRCSYPRLLFVTLRIQVRETLHPSCNLFATYRMLDLFPALQAYWTIRWQASQLEEVPQVCLCNYNRTLDMCARYVRQVWCISFHCFFLNLHSKSKWIIWAYVLVLF